MTLTRSVMGYPFGTTNLVCCRIQGRLAAPPCGTRRSSELRGQRGRTLLPANLGWRMFYTAASETGPNEEQMSSSQRSIILIGDSHIHAVASGYATSAARASASAYEVHKFDSHVARYQPIRTIDDGQSAWNVRFVADILECIERHKPVFIAAVWGGNEHYGHGAVNSPRRYDFVLPTAPNLPLADGAEIVPYDLLVRRFRTPAGALSSLWELLQSCCGLPIYHLAAPHAGPFARHRQPPAAPSTPTSGGIRRHGAILSLQGLASHCGIKTRIMCEAVSYPLPLATRTSNRRPNGMIRDEYAGEGIHGNRDYGALVVGQLDQLVTGALVPGGRSGMNHPYKALPDHLLLEAFDRGDPAG